MIGKEGKKRMLESVDVIELSNRFTLDAIAEVFDCSTHFVRSCIFKQQQEQKTSKSEMNLSKSSSGAWKALKETELFQIIMNK